MKKKLYFVQTSCVFNNEYYLPYAVGMLAAYAFQDEEIKSNYEIADIIYKSDDFEETLRSFDAPEVVAFSNYMWNFEFNLKLAKELKAKFPECVMIFGGHQISDTEKWLKEYPYADFAIFGEGEIIFSQILKALCGKKDFSEILNISYRINDKVIKNKSGAVCADINSYPSPYLSGIFEKILENNTDAFAVIIETSRGCPYHCAYCDWGDYSAPLRHFDYERVAAEIDWIGRHKIVFVTVADSNFGICEDDEKILGKFIAAKKEYGYPVAAEMAFAKLGPERVFKMNKALYENSMSRGATLAMQSLCPEALKNIGRENITKERFSELIKLYSENGIPAYTELILGLPGETYDSFCEGIEYLLDNGLHNSICVFFCEILPNAVMGNPEYIEKHGIEILERKFVLRNGMNPQYGGRSRVIVASSTMNREMFLKSMTYALTVQVLHNFALCRVAAMHFRYANGMKYRDFYNKFTEWVLLNPETFTGKTFAEFYGRYKNAVEGIAPDIYENPVFGETQFNLSDGAFLELASESDKFYRDITAFLMTLCEDKELIEDMVKFQKLIIRKPENIEQSEEMLYNWVDYYLSLLKKGEGVLKKEKNSLKILPSSEYNDKISFAKVIAIKGRRIGKSVALNDNGAFESAR